MTHSELIRRVARRYAETLMSLGVPDGAFYGADYPKPKPDGIVMGDGSPALSFADYIQVFPPGERPFRIYDDGRIEDFDFHCEPASSPRRDFLKAYAWMMAQNGEPVSPKVAAECLELGICDGAGVLVEYKVWHTATPREPSRVYSARVEA